MIDREAPRRVIDALRADGHAVAEVLVKEGRTRRSELSSQGPVSVLTVENGWAVRAGGAAGSFFAAGTGAPPRAPQWPPIGGPPLLLPEPQSSSEWRPGPAIEAPLMVEGEAVGLVEALGRELAHQVQGARILRAVLDDGSSETYLANSRGVDIGYRSRLATLHVEAVVAAEAATRTSLQLAEREARAFHPLAVAQRLANVLAVRGAEPGPRRERGEMIVGPRVGARLLAAWLPLWLGREAAARARGLVDRHDQIGSSRLTLVDDGRLPGGALEAPVDGEGVATRRVVVVENGRYRQPLVEWREADPPRLRACGCVRRPSWRDVPRPGPSHLYIVPDESVAATDLVAAVARGFYLLDVVGPVRSDVEGGRFAVEVCGFGLSQGQASRPIGSAWLCGGIGAFLRGILGVARDLAFIPQAGMVGSPSLLVRGLELRREL